MGLFYKHPTYIYLDDTTYININRHKTMIETILFSTSLPIIISKINNDNVPQNVSQC